MLGGGGGIYTSCFMNLFVSYGYSFSGLCPKTVSRARVVLPTGSTTLLRLQFFRT